MIPESSKDDLITVVQGKDCKYLTWYCNNCKQRHTVPVRCDGETLPLTFKDNYWNWNGSLTNPIVTGTACIGNYSQVGKVYYDCHAVIARKQSVTATYIYTLSDNYVAKSRIDACYAKKESTPKTLGPHKLLPVNDWPPLVSPPEKE
jgi:hypothetical protein